MKSLTLRSLGIVAACLVMLIGISPTSSAAISKAATQSIATNNANTLKISPVRSDVTIEPGASKQVEVIVSNITNQPILLKPIENDFVAGDETGKPALILDENSYATTHSLKRFMVPLSNVTVPAKGSATVNVTIKVPKSAQAGGYFGALRFAPASSNSDKPVNVGASVASLILMTVPGPTVERVTLTNFDVQQNGGTATNFRTPDNLSVLVRFKNEGNLQEGPFGQVYVQKGKKVVYTYNFNTASPKQVILPDSARRWTVPLKGFGKFGKYTIGATLTYGTKNQTIEIVKTVWIIPTAVIMAIVIGIVALGAIILAVWVFLRNYKRRILKSSRRRY